MLLHLRAVLVAALLSFLAVTGEASYADTTPEYKTCVAACRAEGCPRILEAAHSSLTDYRPVMPCTPLCRGARRGGIVGLVYWTCTEDCEYLCKHEVIEEWHRSGNPNSYKFFGKWLFKRRAGMYKIASVLFSLANLYENVRCGTRCWKLYQRIGRQKYRVSRREFLRMSMWLPSWFMTMLAWVLSMWYHLKSELVAEMSDTTVAGSIPATGFIYTLAVTASLGPDWLVAGSVVVACAWVAHAISMFVAYSINRHLTWCIAMELIQAPLWITWCLGPGRTHRARWRVLLFMAFMNAALLLEIFDFPPLWGFFDAHSLWHLVTVPLARHWYTFIEFDLLEMERKLYDKDPSVSDGDDGEEQPKVEEQEL